MTDRCQLNLRLDGRRDLLESCKEIAAAQGLSLNAWVVRQLELGVSAIPQAPIVDTTRQPLDNVLDTTRQPLDKREAIEAPGKFERPSDDDISAATVSVEEAKKHAQIYGFTPEEALADAYFQVNMLTSNFDELEDRYEALKADYAKLLESSGHIKAEREKRIAELRSQLATERADREEIEGELFALKQKSATAGKDFPDAADLLNQLKAKRKKSKTDLADMEAILEILEN